MIEVAFSPKFVRRYKTLDKDLCDEIYEKINLLKDQSNHSQLKVHKLKGKLSNYYSFSVNYKIRIVFQYLSKDEIVLLTVGDHDIYR